MPAQTSHLNPRQCYNICRRRAISILVVMRLEGDSRKQVEKGDEGTYLLQQQLLRDSGLKVHLCGDFSAATAALRACGPDAFQRDRLRLLPPKMALCQREAIYKLLRLLVITLNK